MPGKDRVQTLANRRLSNVSINSRCPTPMEQQNGEHLDIHH